MRARVVKAMVAVAIVWALVLAGCDPNEAKARRQTVGESAKQNAVAWAQELGLRAVGASCSQVDSDIDGYVSCTVNLGDHTEAVECGYEGWLGDGNAGCKKTVTMGRAPMALE